MADPARRFLGIDVGTSGCRVCLIDGQGQVRHEQQAALPASLSLGGHLCQAPEYWWQAVQELITTLPARERIAALAVDATSGTLVPLGDDQQVLGPALMYNDAANQAASERIRAIAPADSAAQGPSSGLAKLLTLRALHGQRLRRVLNQADWIAAQLHGRFDCTDENNALKLGYDPLQRRWPEWLSGLGVAPLLPARVLPPGHPVAPISTRAARRLGLPSDTRIVAGTTDSIAATLASGARAPGEAVTSLGSTLVLKLFSPRPVFSSRHGVYSHRLGDVWLVGGASNSGGAVLRQFFSDRQIQAMTPRLDPNQPTGLDYYPLPRPGERFPVADPDMAPRIHPRPADPVVFFQALLEGIAAIEARGYRLLHELGAPRVQRVYSAGGGAGNRAWTEIRRRALGVEVLPARQQQAAYGAALLARQAFAEDLA